MDEKQRDINMVEIGKVMKTKLIQDFFEAVEVDKLITKGQLDIDNGVVILKNMIQYIRDDIFIVDEEASKIVDKEITELDKQNKAWKAEREKGIEVPNDSIDERNLKLLLLRADHRKYKKELFFIQRLAHRKGWFD